MNEQEPTATTCSHCGIGIEGCEFCDEADCQAALCFDCVNEELGQIVSQPHTHGG